MSGQSDTGTHHSQKRTDNTANKIPIGQSELFPVQMSGKSDLNTHIPTPKNYKNANKTALGKSELFPVQMSSKSDKSTHQSPPKTHKNTKKHILGKSELSPVQKSGKSDTSTHHSKKQYCKKAKKRTDKRSKRSGEPDFEKIPFDPTSHYISPKNKIPNTIQVPRKDFGEPNFCSSNSQLLLRRTNLVNSRQIPRENVSIGIDRKYNVPRVFTKAKRGDFRSYYQKFMKTNLSGPAYEKYRKYVVT